VIEVDRVTRRFGDLVAVDRISFRVERGEIVGFVGPNGAGKSTLLKILATFLLPSSGHAWIEGRDVAEEPLAVRRRIGYLAGDTPLYRQMKAGAFLAFIGKARGLHGAALAEAVDRVAGEFGLGPALRQRIDHCSTGFRQRLGLAAALMHDPPVLLLDEPTHGFDPLQTVEFRKQLEQLRPGRAILFSTHIISDVEAVSDRVLIINQGTLLGDGTLSELSRTAGVEDGSLEEVFASLVRSAGPHG